MDMDQTKAEHVPNVQKKELTLKNRLAYAGTDAAGNLLYQLFSHRCFWFVDRSCGNDCFDSTDY